MATPAATTAPTKSKSITTYSIKKNKNKNKNKKRNVPVTAKTITIQAPKINKATTTTVPLTNKSKSKSRTRPIKSTSARPRPRPRVAAKKATVSAPITTRTTTRTTRNSIKQKYSGKNEEFDVISLGSLSSASSNEISKDSNTKNKIKDETETNVNIEVVRSKTYEVVRSKISKPVTKIRIIQEGPISSGRVKKAQKEQEINGHESFVRTGRHSRPTEFLGGIRLATIANNMFNTDNSGPKSIVLEKSTFDVTKERRKRVSWGEEEVENLKIGVKRHGEGSWSSILQDNQLNFNSQRTQIDLKDKWRNLVAYVPYEQHPMRRYALVNSKHQLIISPSGNPHVFNNRWPRDAALKVATRDEFYPIDENGHRPEIILIHLKEIMDERVSRERPPTVYVYRATRILQKPRNIKKFAGYSAVWTGQVEKVAEELLVKAVDILPIQQAMKFKKID